MSQIKVDVKFDDATLYPDGFKPTKPGDAGIDLKAMFDVTLEPGECKPVRTGVYLHMHDPNVFAMVLPRSGLGAKQGLVLGNTAGVVDSGYQGEVLCFMWNRNETETGKKIEIKRGDRFAQLLFLPVLTQQVALNPVAAFSFETERGASGFGSSGK